MQPSLKPNFVGLTRDFGHYATPWKEHLIFNKEDEFSYGSRFCSHMGMELVPEECVANGPVKCRYHGLPAKDLGPLWRAGEFLFLPGKIPTCAFSPLLSISEDLGECFQTVHSSGYFPWWIWMQNTMDPNHLHTVHKDGFASLFHEDTKPFGVFTEGYFSSYYMPVKKEAQERFSRYVSGPLSDTFFHATIFPNFSVTSFLRSLYSIETMEEVCGETRVTTRYFMSKYHKPSPVLLKAAKLGHEKILSEDVEICERLAQNYKRPEFFLPGEERIKAFLSLVHGD